MKEVYIDKDQNNDNEKKSLKVRNVKNIMEDDQITTTNEHLIDIQ